MKGTCPMANLARWTIIPALVSGWFAAAAPAPAASAGGHDHGTFFSKDVIRKADEQIREIHDRSHKDLDITTFPGIPADKKKQFEAAGKENRNRFFAEWLQELAHED